MKLKEIVSCWVENKVQSSKNLEELESYFIGQGYKSKRINKKKIKLKKGSPVAFTFDYGGDKLEVQMYLEDLGGEEYNLTVGNWGFPFEPLFMKKRFKKVLEQTSLDIEQLDSTQPQESPEK